METRRRAVQLYIVEARKMILPVKFDDGKFLDNTLNKPCLHYLCGEFYRKQ